MTRTQRALQIWQVLIAAAHNRQLLTYELLAECIYGKGKKGAGTLSDDLGVIMQYCQANSLPYLTVLMVSTTTGDAPGASLITVAPENRDQELEKVYGYKWFELKPLETHDLQSLTMSTPFCHEHTHQPLICPLCRSAKGGKNTVKRYSKEQLAKWGKMGGRPRKTAQPENTLGQEAGQFHS